VESCEFVPAQCRNHRIRVYSRSFAVARPLPCQFEVARNPGID
jgi:hypothetical protein